MLARYADDLPQCLLPRARYRPFPDAADRPAWEALPPGLRDARIAAGETVQGMQWPPLPARLFMEYRRGGNRRRYEQLHFERRRALADLVVAECCEGKGRFLDDITDGIWSLCEESFWGVPAHNGAQRFPEAALPDTSERIIDLFAGETAGLLTWTHYLLGASLDAVSPIVADRIRREVTERILDPYLARDDFRWMGLDAAGRARPVNNWNPWCNSNCLTALLLLEEDAPRRAAGVTKALHSLDRFLAAYHSDGGCDEGTSYWDRAGGSLFDCLELLRGATEGRIDLYDEPLIADIGRYLYRAHISGDYFVNFADGGARVKIAADLVYRYGRRIGDPKLMALGAAAHRRRQEKEQAAGVPGSLLRTLPALFNAVELDAAAAEPPYVRDVWLDGIEVMAAREEEGSDRGLYLAAKGGHNGESHNHNDVGQFLVSCDGMPVLIDVGVETYTAKTFSARRYEIWTMQSAYHNLPTIGGVQQAAGREYGAREVRYEADDTRAQLTLDIAAAYPPEAGLVSWQRSVHLERGAAPAVRVFDRFQLAETSDVTLSLMTPRAPQFSQPGVILLPSTRTIQIEYPSEELEATHERIAIDDARLLPVWGDHLFRMTLRSRRPVSRGEWGLCITAL